MRVGVVGCGYWGAKHVRVLHELPDVERVVLVDQDEASLGSLRRVFPGVEVHRQLETALDHIDALVVATPPVTHFDVAMAAIEAGRHVLVEKPLAPTVAQAEEMVAAAEARGVTLMVGHTFEFNPAVWRLRDALRDGELGNVYYIDSVRLNLGPIRRDVNVIGDLAPHDISIANFILGARPTAVTAWGSAHTHPWIEDTATVRLDYGTLGIAATLRVSWLDPCKVRRTTVVGDRMMAVYNDLDDNERIKLYDRGVVDANHGADHATPMSYRYGGISAPYLQFREPLVVEDEHFVKSVLRGERPSVDGRNGLGVVRVLEAAQFAVREGRTIPIDWPADELTGAATSLEQAVAR
jgi:predicted dehydrogenase